MVIPASYTVTYNQQGATTSSVPTSSIVTLPFITVSALPTDPVKTGFTFGGWWKAINGGGTQFLVTTSVTADITVYAKWT